jgi:hypothetical protein
MERTYCSRPISNKVTTMAKSINESQQGSHGPITIESEGNGGQI